VCRRAGLAERPKVPTAITSCTGTARTMVVLLVMVAHLILFPQVARVLPQLIAR
jgi:hypothetical protein